MEQIVYFLGAGFSAPLGLPVMRTFLMRSKDMYAAEPERYRHFREVFECISELARIQSYLRR
jgi:NAD-dependent SIR2 family protein deacetylase